MSADDARIPVARPDLAGREEEYLVSALRSSWISSSGPFLDRFEREFAALCGTRASVGVTNGTVALHLALLALDVRPGDEVLVPSLSYIAVANVCRYVGAEPVFVDVDPETWCLDPRRIEASITRRTKGVIAVHLYGHPASMDEINALAGVHGLWVVEDAAEAHLARYRDRPVGGLARVGTFSFYGNKIFTSGEGGALTLDDPQLERRVRTLRGQGVDPGRRYFFPVTGYNFRMTNLAAALLCAQLERRDQMIADRRRVFATYRRLLAGVPGIAFQPEAPWVEAAPWLFCATVDPAAYGRTRDELMQLLEADNIETRPFFIPLHSLPPFREQSTARGERLPTTEALASSGLNLPTYGALTDADIARVAESVRRHAR